MQADARHAAAVARLEQTFRLLGDLPEFRSELNEEFGRVAPVVPFPQEKMPGARVRSRRIWSGVAAGLAGLLLVWGVLQAPRHETEHVTTAAGYERARLEDGSTLELNAASAVKVRFNAAERRVAMERGEVHFDVSHDENRPFIVTAGGVSVRAVGTAFNVKVVGSAVEVLVTEGKVRVSRGDMTAVAGETAPLVVAGERARMEREVAIPRIEKIEPEALRATLAWQTRLVEFSDAPLGEVIKRFNARNRLQLVLADPSLSARRIGGTFVLDEVEAFVRLLERDGELVSQRRGDSEIVLQAAR
jgi:transmembrane sensor